MTQERDPIRLLRLAADELERERLRPLAKTEPEDVKVSLRAEVHLEFVRTCDRLEQQGVSHSDIARYFGVTRQTMSDWYKYGASERKQLPGYAPKGVERLLVAAMCSMVANG